MLLCRQPEDVERLYIASVDKATAHDVGLLCRTIRPYVAGHQWLI